MNLGAILLGLVDIGIVVAIFVLIGLVIVWVLGYLGFPVPANIQKVYLVIVALIALYMLIALLLGLPRMRIMSSATSSVPPVSATIGPPKTQVIR